MATYTTNYNLKKPADSDFINVADFNGNADIIDAELKKRPTVGDDGKLSDDLLPDLSETYEEKGAAATAVSAHNTSASAHNDIRTTLANHTGSTTMHVTSSEKTTWNAKQNALTFDTTPKSGSTNPVTSGGVYTALSAKAAASALSSHTSNSTIHVTSSEKSTWNAKQAALTFDTAPTASSTNPVTSGGVKTALDKKQDASTAITTSNIGSQTVMNAKYAYNGNNDTPGAFNLRNQCFVSSESTPGSNCQIAWVYG